MKTSQLALFIAILHVLTSYLVEDNFDFFMLSGFAFAWLFVALIYTFMEYNSWKLGFDLRKLEKEYDNLVSKSILARLDILIALQTKDKKKLKEVIGELKK